MEPRETNPPDKKLLSRFIAHFSRHTFTEFVKELFRKEENYYDLRPLTEAGEDVFYRPYLDSYGGSIHEVLLLHFPPFELFQPSARFTIDDPTLINKLVRIRNIYHDRTGKWGMVDPYLKTDDALKAVKFITNLFGMERKEYEDTLIPAYQRLKRYCGIKNPRAFVGSCDSFVDLNLDETQLALSKIAHRYKEGIAVSISIDDVIVRDFTAERNLASGVSPGTRGVYEPVIVRQAIHNQGILSEFQALLRSDPSEARLQEFLVAHYKEIFGSKYDRIETELWLRFPELDIRNKDRRLDLFLRNSIRNDWDLFEIKRPITLTSTYRDIPVFVSEVSNAIHQVRNYGRILAQDKVKRHLEKEGIEFFKPEINLVIGRTPQIPHAQWRWLQSGTEGGVRIFTFDELLAELRRRLDDRYAVLKALIPPTI
ncbi:MAG: hypothetical protein JWM83_2039 [Candidatus Angelobacter sp.]|nr:hypothetical protein [Candidatus Angelobacter sp.]